MVAEFAEVIERKRNFACGGLQPSELFSPDIPLSTGSRSGLVNRPLRESAAGLASTWNNPRRNPIDTLPG
jgi:hypothetical protein